MTTDAVDDLIQLYVDGQNRAYEERNRLVAVLTYIWPSHLVLAESGSGDWDTVCVHSPEGQMTWHIPDRDMHLFQHLGYAASHWDGHTTPLKYDRLILAASAFSDARQKNGGG